MIWLYKYLLNALPLIPLVTCQKVELLDDIVIPFYIPINNAPKFQFLHIHQCILFSGFLKMSNRILFLKSEMRNCTRSGYLKFWAPGVSGSRGVKSAGDHPSLYQSVCVCACVCACVRVRVCVFYNSHPNRCVF